MCGSIIFLIAVLNLTCGRAAYSSYNDLAIFQPCNTPGCQPCSNSSPAAAELVFTSANGTPMAGGNFTSNLCQTAVMFVGYDAQLAYLSAACDNAESNGTASVEMLLVAGGALTTCSAAQMAASGGAVTKIMLTFKVQDFLSGGCTPNLAPSASSMVGYLQGNVTGSMKLPAKCFPTTTTTTSSTTTTTTTTTATTTTMTSMTSSTTTLFAATTTTTTIKSSTTTTTTKGLDMLIESGEETQDFKWWHALLIAVAAVVSGLLCVIAVFRHRRSLRHAAEQHADVQASAENVATPVDGMALGEEVMGAQSEPEDVSMVTV